MAIITSEISVTRVNTVAWLFRNSPTEGACAISKPAYVPRPTSSIKWTYPPKSRALLWSKPTKNAIGESTPTLLSPSRSHRFDYADPRLPVVHRSYADSVSFLDDHYYRNASCVVFGIAGFGTSHRLFSCPCSRIDISIHGWSDTSVHNISTRLPVHDSSVDAVSALSHPNDCLVCVFLTNLVDDLAPVDAPVTVDIPWASYCVLTHGWLTI